MPESDDDILIFQPVKPVVIPLFTVGHAIEVAKKACARAFDEMAEQDLLDEHEFNANMAIYLAAAFKEDADKRMKD